MPKRQSLWKRETQCLVCEHKMNNYQAMAKSQSIEYDKWLVGHSRGLGDYDDYPSTLKTTVCPNCLMASNEYSFGVDDYKYFTRNMRKNGELVEMFKETEQGRFKALAREFASLEDACAILDLEKGKPANMRCRATLEKVWRERDKYGERFFTMLLSEPRDYATALVCFALDRHCQMLRLGYEKDIQYDANNPEDVHQKVKEFFEGTRLEMKSAETRLFYIATNYQQCIQFIDEMLEHIPPQNREKYEERKKLYAREAFDFYRYSYANEDMTAIPLEFKEGGIGYLLCLFYRERGEMEEATRYLRIAKRYADNTLKKISTTNQQNFINWVDDLCKELLAPEGEGVQPAQA